jgi:hypothetical protein
MKLVQEILLGKNPELFIDINKIKKINHTKNVLKKWKMENLEVVILFM